MCRTVDPRLAKKRPAWLGAFACVVGALVFPGCIGGWTGESSATGIDCPMTELAFDATSSRGTSAKALLERFGGAHQGSTSDGSSEFWSNLLGSPIALPAAVRLDITYTNGAVVEDGCSRMLAVPVELTVTIGDGVATYRTTTTLRETSGGASLATLVPRVEDATAPQLSITVSFADASTGATIAGIQDATFGTVTITLD